jgi:ATP-dependent exoDNAse (exonuclease V) beta subunit
MWNNAEAPEPPTNLTATLRGAVIHRFCETFERGMDVMACLTTSFDSVVAQRDAAIDELIDSEQRDVSLTGMLPLAENYLASDVFKRVESARGAANSETGLRILSEQEFVLRRPLGSLSGTIDKMLVTPAGNLDYVDVEIVDFKTDRFPKRKPRHERQDNLRPHSQRPKAQDQSPLAKDDLIQDQVTEAAFDYELQMQAYALAVRELIPNLNELRVTILFLDPNIEASPLAAMLDYSSCAKAIDSAMMHLLSSAPDNYPTRTAEHCRFCNFREICIAGQAWERSHSPR